jgi:hypothetical protein
MLGIVHRASSSICSCRCVPQRSIADIKMITAKARCLRNLRRGGKSPYGIRSWKYFSTRVSPAGKLIASASPSAVFCRIRDALEPKSRVKWFTCRGTATGGSMPRPMMFFVPAILIMPLATVLGTGQTSVAEPAVDECKTAPGSSAPPGSHWYYRVNRTDQRHCWFLGPEGAQVRSQALKTPARASSPTRTSERENAVEMARAKSVPVEPAQKISLEAASAEPNKAAADFAAPSADLPKTPDLDAREPPTINSNYTDAPKLTDAQEEMPLIWPVLTEAERAGLPDAAGESAPGTLFLVGALAMVLLCAGAIFKLARQRTQSSRRNRRVVPRRPRTSPQMRAHLAKMAARPDEVARRPASGARQRPRSVNPTHDAKASLRKIMDELQRVAA